MLLSKLVCSEGVTTRGTIVSRRFCLIGSNNIVSLDMVSFRIW
jgi:hypothetical protein